MKADEAQVPTREQRAEREQVSHEEARGDREIRGITFESLHQWESNGPVKDGGGADQQAEAKQADVKSAAAWTNMQHGQEGAIGRVVHRRDMVLKRARVKGMQGHFDHPQFCKVGQLHELSFKSSP